MMMIDLQTTQTGLPTVPESQGPEAMGEQTLLADLEVLSQEITVLRAQEALLAEQDRLQWEIALLGALYRREALSGELLLRQIGDLEPCWTRVRHDALARSIGKNREAAWFPSLSRQEVRKKRYR